MIVQVQRLRFNDDDYRLVVLERNGAWEATATRNERRIYYPVRFGSEADAKQALYDFLRGEAGVAPPPDTAQWIRIAY